MASAPRTGSPDADRDPSDHRAELRTPSAPRWRSCGTFRSTRSTSGFGGSFPKQAGAEYEAVMRETFGVAADSWKGFEFDGTAFAGGEPDRWMASSGCSEDCAVVVSSIRRAGNRGSRSFRTSRPRGCPSTSPTSDRPSGTSSVPSRGISRRSSPTGKSASAAIFPTTSSATCGPGPFREIWTGEKAWRFREKLLREPLPICSRCCGSYVYGKWERPPGDQRAGGVSQKR